MTQGSLLDLAAELEQLAEKAVRDHDTAGPWPPCPQSHWLQGLLCACLGVEGRPFALAQLFSPAWPISWLW